MQDPAAVPWWYLCTALGKDKGRIWVFDRPWKIRFVIVSSTSTPYSLVQSFNSAIFLCDLSLKFFRGHIKILLLKSDFFSLQASGILTIRWSLKKPFWKTIEMKVEPKSKSQLAELIWWYSGSWLSGATDWYGLLLPRHSQHSRHLNQQHFPYL